MTELMRWKWRWSWPPECLLQPDVVTLGAWAQTLQGCCLYQRPLGTPPFVFEELVSGVANSQGWLWVLERTTGNLVLNSDHEGRTGNTPLRNVVFPSLPLCLCRCHSLCLHALPSGSEVDLSRPECLIVWAFSLLLRLGAIRREFLVWCLALSRSQ